MALLWTLLAILVFIVLMVALLIAIKGQTLYDDEKKR